MNSDNIDLQLVLFLLMPIVLWVWGYFDTRFREVSLPNSIKYLFGKPGQPIHKAGFLSQSSGIILAISYGLAFLELKTNLKFIISPNYYFILSILIMALATLFDEKFLLWKRDKLK